MQEVEVVELNEPNGWIAIPLKDAQDKYVYVSMKDMFSIYKKCIIESMLSRYIRTFMLQLAILSNHQSGRDTHLRNVRVHSPVSQTMVAIKPLQNFQFLSREMCMFNTLK